jgi:hypothetical protein
VESKRRSDKQCAEIYVKKLLGVASTSRFTGLKQAFLDGWNQRKVEHPEEFSTDPEFCSDVKELCNLITGSSPDTTIKGKIESLAFGLGHYPCVLNAKVKQ